MLFSESTGLEVKSQCQIIFYMLPTEVPEAVDFITLLLITNQTSGSNTLLKTPHT